MAGLLACVPLQAAKDVRAVSPNGKLLLERQGDGYVVRCDGRPAVILTQVGITTTSTGGELTFRRMYKCGRVKDDYRMISGKQRHPHNEANAYVFEYADGNGRPVRLVFRLYNDGVAFRYELSGLKDERLKEERTVFFLPEGTRRWIQEWNVAYEDFYRFSTSGRQRRIAFPALMEPSDGLFVLLSEANIERRQSAASLYNDGVRGAYRVVPDQNETTLSGSWHSPWRIAIVGTLADVTESTLVTDVSEPCVLKDTDWIRPGAVSWVYWAYNRGSKDFQTVRSYIDLAAELGLPYVLIDWEWDVMSNGGDVDDALRYAREKGVKVLLWYNSSTAWVENAAGPAMRLNTPERREREFQLLEDKGVAGVKIDFFEGDGQPTMDYCIDLLACAARHHLYVNFHGATVPRGWQRTYPNLLTTEGVLGAEWYNNVDFFTRAAAAHNATLPFTRNVVGPMDYTPCAFSDSQHPHITTHAHELALTVLFESGLQHLADRPQSFLAQPAAVRRFLGRLPTAWDETRLLSGYPGVYAVMARRCGDTWYVAGINGSDEPRTIALDAGFIKTARRSILSFADSGDSARPWQIDNLDRLPESVRLQPRGGFIFVIEGKR